MDVVVASFEIAFLRGDPRELERARAEAAGAWAVSVASAAATNVPATWGAGAPVARLPVVREPDRRDPLSQVAAHRVPLLAFGEALSRRWPYDLVHAHTGLPDGLAASALAERVGVPLLVTEHDSTSPRTLLEDPAAAAAYRGLVRDGRGLVAVSRALADRLTDALGVSSELVGVVANPVPLDRFPLGPAGDRDPNLLLWVGARRASKGMDALLRAFARARLDRPGLRLRMIGRSDDAATEAGWHALAGELGVADAAMFDPPADRDAVADAMRRAALFVHPSPWETFGLVAAEALASGLPVAAMPSGGVPEIVGTGGTCGEIADGDDSEALARAIGRLIDRRDDFDPSVLRRRIAERYASDVVWQALAERYARLLARGIPPAKAVPPAVPIAAPIAGPAVPAAPVRPSAPDASSTPAGPPAVEVPPLVIGTHRTSAFRRLAALPPELARSLTVVTVAPPRTDGPDDMAAPAGCTLVQLDPEAPYRAELGRIDGSAAGSGRLPPTAGGGRVTLAVGRLSAAGGIWRALRAPISTISRRRLAGRRASLRTHALAAGVAAAWRAMPADPRTGRRPGLVCLDAADVVAAAGAIGSGAHLEPGGLRWLADQWDEGMAGRERASSHAPDAPKTPGTPELPDAPEATPTPG
jgi:D-inositol-3-phosphate glycosyltransferase